MLVRIKYLNLPAFGIFTDRTIRFAPNHGLHIIYGRNEAGKSTLLSAISDALFGIPRNTPHAFLHKPSALRIVMGLKFADGTELDFVRRRGTKNTIHDAEGEPLPEDILVPYLAGLNRSDFEEMFGLDHLRLREGGQRLLEAGGEFSQSLFEAASGMRYLTEEMETLEAAAVELYGPQARVRPVNLLAAEYREAQRAVEDAVLSVNAFKELEKRYLREQATLREIAAKLATGRAQEARFNRIKRTKPLLTQLHTLQAELEALGTLPDLPADSAKRYQELKDNLRRVVQDKEKAEQEVKALQEKLKGLAIPQDLLDQEAAVTALFRGLDKYTESVENLPQLEYSIESAKQNASAQLKKLYPGAENLEEADQYRRPYSVVAAVEDLVDEYEEIEQALSRAQEQVGHRTEELQRTQRDLQDFGPIQDTGGLQRIVTKIQKKGDLEKQHQDKLLEIKQREEQLKSRLQRLPLWERTLEELSQAELPLESTVNGYIQEEKALRDELRILAKEIAELEQHETSLKGELKRLSISGSVPSEEELASARKRRDYGWQLVRRSWLDKQPDEAGEKEFSPEKPLSDAYEESVSHADQIADELRRESDRVAQIQTLEAQLKNTADALHRKKEEQQNLLEQQAAFLERWRQVWAPLHITPLSPQEMEEWLGTAKSLIEDHAGLEKDKVAADKLYEQIESYRTELGEALEELGEPVHGSLSDLLERANEITAKTAERRGEYRRLTKAVSEQEDALEKAQTNLKSAEEQEKEWKERWTEAMHKIGLAASTTAKTAQGYLEELTKLFDLIKQLDEAQKVRDQQRKQIKDYESRVKEVAAQTTLAVDLDNIPQAVTALWKNLQEASKNLTRREEILEQIESQQDIIAELKREESRTADEIKGLMEAAKCTSQEELEDLLKRHSEAEELRTKIENTKEQLVLTGDGLSLSELEAEAENVDADSISGELATLEQELAELSKERDELNQAFGVTQKEYKEKVEGASAEAVEAAEKAQHTLARLATETERYIKLKMASAILRKAVERYREEHQDPVLKRAGEIFSALTEGSFTHLTADYDDKDNLVIRGVRDGEPVGVEGMSDGTQDQLYLALRLASIERYLEEKEPIPFIVDDVLINFDDHRSAAALRTLAELAEKTQVIMFTHHWSVVQMAQRELSEKGFALYLLGDEKVTEPASLEALASLGIS